MSVNAPGGGRHAERACYLLPHSNPLNRRRHPGPVRRGSTSTGIGPVVAGLILGDLGINKNRFIGSRFPTIRPSVRIPMSRRIVGACLSVLLLASAGCEVGSEIGQPAGNSSGQPKDLQAPWVKKTDLQVSVSTSSSDPGGNHIYSCTASDFRSLLEDIAAEFKTPIVVKPGKMLDWNLTVDVKGKDADEVLKDIATKCRLSLTKSSGGLPMLVYPDDPTGNEATVKPGDDDGENDTE